MLFKIVNIRGGVKCHDVLCHGYEHCYCRKDSYPKMFEGRPGEIVLVYDRVDHYAKTQNEEYHNIFSYLILHRGSVFSIVGDAIDFEFQPVSE